jgi:hypothetical protein
VSDAPSAQLNRDVCLLQGGQAVGNTAMAACRPISRSNQVRGLPGLPICSLIRSAEMAWAGLLTVSGQGQA